MIDDIQTEVYEALVFAGLGLKHGTDIEFQLVEYFFVDIAIRIDQVAKQLILFDGLKMLLRDFNTACATGIGLNLVHNRLF
jgi:hypothetical protein